KVRKVIPTPTRRSFASRSIRASRSSPRRSGLAWVGTGLAAAFTSSQALAHGFGQRYELPLPLTFYVFGAAAVVLLSGVVFALFRVGPHAGSQADPRAGSRVGPQVGPQWGSHPGTPGERPHRAMRAPPALIAALIAMLKAVALAVGVIAVLAGFLG